MYSPLLLRVTPPTTSTTVPGDKLLPAITFSYVVISLCFNTFELLTFFAMVLLLFACPFFFRFFHWGVYFVFVVLFFTVHFFPLS